jgi:Fur family ferric uptake transcriptional regulator
MAALHQKEKEELRRILQQRGHRNSEDLLNILDVFLSTEEHLTVTSLCQRLKARGFRFSPGQVSNALDLFRRYGFAQVERFQDQEDRFEHRHLGLHHDHMICTRCGRVEEFNNEEMERLQNRIAAEKGFTPLQHRMEMYGLCRDCSRAREASRRLCEAECGEQLRVVGYDGGDELAPSPDGHGYDAGLGAGSDQRQWRAAGGVLPGCRLALGRGMSEKVMVAPAGGQEPVGGSS